MPIARANTNLLGRGEGASGRVTPTSRTTAISTPGPRTLDAAFTPVRGGRSGTSNRSCQALISRVECMERPAASLLALLLADPYGEGEKNTSY